MGLDHYVLLWPTVWIEVLVELLLQVLLEVFKPTTLDGVRVNGGNWKSQVAV